MATVKPRVQVVLEPKVYKTLQRIARHSNASMSSLLANMATEAEPNLRQLADLLEKSNGVSAALSAAVAGKIGQVEAELIEGSFRAQDVLDELQLDVEDYIEKQGAGASARSRRGQSAGASVPSLD